MVKFTDGFSPEPPADAVMGLTYNPTDNTFWITDTFDVYAYHFNKSGEDLGDGHDLGADGISCPTGITYDTSDDSFWVADSGRALIDGHAYHYNSSWGDLTDDIDMGAFGAGAVEGIAYDSSDDSLWAVDLLDKFVYHFNASDGTLMLGGFFTAAAGCIAPSGITYDPTDDTLWIVDVNGPVGGKGFIFHFDKLGNKLSDGFDFIGLTGSHLPEAIGFDTTDNTFWIPDDEDMFIYHVGPEDKLAKNSYIKIPNTRQKRNR
ncbi:MAG: hypothetical protein WBC02_07740 [Candidatus Aminicenantaceae bacterium]